MENAAGRLDALSVPGGAAMASAGAASGGKAPVEAPPLVKMYDAAVLDGPFKEFVQLSSKIGGDVESIGALTKDAFQAQRVFLWKAAGMAKPGEAELANLLKPTSDKIESIQSMKSAKRQSSFFNHLSAIAEGIPALGWVTVSPTPAPFIKEMSDASQFYTNRVLKDFKEKDKTHTDWVKAWLQTLSELQLFVKQNHTTGLVWNTTPGAAPSAAGAVSSGGPPPPPPISGMPPPPPPPPPPADFGKNLDNASADADARAALFAEINKGLDITKGLKKVTSDMQTHKNPALRTTAPVPGAAGDQHKPMIPPKPAHLSNGSGSTPSPPGAKKAGAPSGPEPTPVLMCEGGKKWLVEYHKGNRNIVVEIADMRQVVYIYKCVDCVVQIKGKANSITMDSCKKTSVVFDNLLSCMEIINCQSAQVQTLGAMPTLTIQKTDGCQVYLSKDSLNAEIVTSKSSEMNILVPDETGEFHELPVPEQYRTVVKGKKLFTEVVDIA